VSEHTDLAARQISLVAALVAGAPPPAGVDETRVRIQAADLLRKRSRSVARRNPELAARLGQDFWPTFQDYDRARTGPPPDCSAADAREFTRYLRRTGRGRRWPGAPPGPRRPLS
jgi:hypothetical protein